MTKIPIEALPALYGDFMRQLKRRMGGIDAALARAATDREGMDAALELEFCYLQLRMSIELIALSALIAHNEIEAFRTKDIMKAWHADDLLKRLSDLNPQAFPTPIVVNEPGPDGVADMFMMPVGDSQERLISIYGQCGARLHTGSLRSVLKTNGRMYRAQEVRDWRNFIVEMLNAHVVMLPSCERMMVTYLLFAPTMDVHCFLTDFQKDAVIHPLGPPSRKAPH